LPILTLEKSRSLDASFGGANTNVSIENRGVGFVFQDYAVWPHMSVAENVGSA